MSKRPCDMTNVELEALPIGPIVRAYGPPTKTQHEKRPGFVFTYAVRPRTTLNGYDHDDIIGWRDKHGSAWGFGQWATGQWYKTSLPF